LGYIDGIHVTIYDSTMDPMGMNIYDMMTVSTLFPNLSVVSVVSQGTCWCCWWRRWSRRRVDAVDAANTVPWNQSRKPQIGREVLDNMI
jgi:hypothetical protein